MGCHEQESFTGYNSDYVDTANRTRFDCLGWACPNLSGVLDKIDCEATNVGSEPQNNRCGLAVQVDQAAAATVHYNLLGESEPDRDSYNAT